MATNVGNIINNSGNLNVSIKQAGQSSNDNKVLLTSGVTLTYTWGSDASSMLYNTTSANNSGTLTWTSSWKHNHNTLGKVSTNSTLTLGDTSIPVSGGSTNLAVHNTLDSGTTDTRSLRSQDIKYTITYAGLSKTFSSKSDATPAGIFQSAYNSPEPILVTSVSSDASWISFDKTSTTRNSTGINTDSVFGITVASNIPKLSGSFSGTSSIVGNSTMGATGGSQTLKAKISNYTENIDDSSSTASSRTGTITAKYTTSFSQTTPTSKSITLTQEGGSIPFERPAYTYSWSSNSSWLTLSNTSGDSVTASVSYNGGTLSSMSGTVNVTYNDNLPITGGNINIKLTTNAGSNSTQGTSTSDRTGTVTLKTVPKSSYITGNISNSTLSITQSGKTNALPTMTVAVSSNDSLGTSSVTYNGISKVWNSSDTMTFSVPSSMPTDSSAYISDDDLVWTHPSFASTQYGSDLYDTTLYGFSTHAGSITSVADKKYTFDISSILGVETTGSVSVSPSKISITRKGQSGEAWQYGVPTITIGSNPNSSWVGGTFNTTVSPSNYPTASDTSHSDITFNSSNPLTLPTVFYPTSANKGSASWNSWVDKTFSSSAQTVSTVGPTFAISNSSTRQVNIPVTFAFTDSDKYSASIADTINVKQTGSSGSATVNITSNSSNFTVSNNTNKTSGANFSITMSDGNAGTVSGTMTSKGTGNGTSSVSGAQYTFPYDKSGEALTLTLGGLTYTNGTDKTGTLTATMSVSSDLNAPSSKTINVTQSGQTVKMSPYLNTSSFVSVDSAFPSFITSGGTGSAILSITPNYGESSGSISGTVGVSPSTKSVANTGGVFSIAGSISNFSNTSKTSSSSPRSVEISYGIKFTGTSKSDVTGKLTIYQEGQSIESVPSSITYQWTTDASWLTLSNTSSNTVTVTPSHNHGSMSGGINYSTSIGIEGIDNPNYITADGDNCIGIITIDSYSNTLSFNNTSSRSGKVTLKESIGSFWNSSASATVTQAGYTYAGTPSMTYSWYKTPYVDWLSIEDNHYDESIITVSDNSSSVSGSVSGTVSVSPTGPTYANSSVNGSAGKYSFTGALSNFSNTLKANNTSSRSTYVYCDTYINGFASDSASIWFNQLGDTSTIPSSITYKWMSGAGTEIGTAYSWINTGDTGTISNTVLLTLSTNNATGSVSGSIKINKANPFTVTSSANTSMVLGIVPSITNSLVSTSTRHASVKLRESLGNEWTSTSPLVHIYQYGESNTLSITYQWSKTGDWLSLSSTTSSTPTLSYTSNAATVSGSISGTAALDATSKSVVAGGVGMTSTVSLMNYFNTVYISNKAARTGTVTCKASASWNSGSWSDTYTLTINQQASSVPGSVSGITYTWGKIDNNNMISILSGLGTSSINYDVNANNSTQGKIENVRISCAPSQTEFAASGGTMNITYSVNSYTGTAPVLASSRSAYVYCKVSQSYPSTLTTRIWTSQAGTYINQSASATFSYPNIALRWETTNGDLAYLELDYALTNNGLVQTAQYGTTSINIPAGSSAGSYSASTKPYSGSAYKFAFRKSTLSSGANYIISKAGGTYVPVTYYFTQSTGYTGVVEAKSWTLQAKLSSYSDTTKPDIVFTPDSWTVNRQASSGSIIAAPALTVSKSNISFTGVPSWITMSVSSSVTLIPSYSGALTRNVTSGSSMTSVSGITFTVPSNTGATSSWTSPSLSSKYIPSSTSSTSGTVESGLYPTSTLSNVSSRDTTICVYMSGTYIGAMRVLQAGDSPSRLYYTVSTSSDGWSVGNTGNILARTAWTYTAPASNQFGYIYYYTYTTAYTYNYKYTYTHHYTYTTSYTYNYKYTYTTSYTYNYPYTYTYAYTYTTSYTYNTPYTLSSTSQSLSSDSTTSNGVHTWNNTVAYWRLNITLNYSAGTVSHAVGNTDKVQNGDPTKSGGSTHNDTTGSTTKTNTGRSDSTGSTLKVDDCSSNGYNHPKVTNNGYTSSEGSTTKTDTGTGINGNNSVKTGTFVVKSTSNALDGTSVNKTIYLYKSAVQDSSLDTTSITRNASITNTTTINYTADITRNASITNTATITRNASITNTATITKNATITPKASINYTSSYASVECSSSISNSSDFTLVGQTTSISSGGTTWTGVVYGKGDAFTTKSTTLTVNLTSNGSTKTVTQTFTINALTWTAHNS